ncbi:MAG: tetratricopeptide repeat protein [Bacteroidia bacterium]|nr:tetratricopeptide repeat protein [Bacteroidia bacterium]
MLRNLTPAILALIAMLLQSCAVWNFVDVRWQNATGYFNTYYNASRLFDEAEEEIAENQFTKSIDPTKGSLSVAAAPRGTTFGEDESTARIKHDMAHIESGIPSSAIQKLDRVIEKCSRLIVNYPKSKWVDNGLLLIGKSYFYKQELTRAERKFQELLDRYPDSDLVTEAILWLGKTYVKLEQYELAHGMFERAIMRAVSESEPDLAAQAHFEMGKMYLALKQGDAAIANFERAAEFDADRYFRIQVQIALAREYERNGDKKKAAQAFQDIFKLDPNRDLAFIAELNYAKLQREMGELDEASNTIIDMLDNPMYLDYDAKIQLEIGHLYREYFRHYQSMDDDIAGDAFTAALEQYRYVDTTFKSTAEAADALYAKGELYELDLKDYDNAFDNYNNAKLAFPGAESAQLAGKKAGIFGDYRKLRRRMYDTDTTLFYARNPDSLRVRDSLQVITDSLDREKRIAEVGRDALMTPEEKMAERFRRRRPHGRNTGRINPWMMEKEKAQSPAMVGLMNTEQAVASAGPAYRRLNLSAIDKDSLQASLAVLQMEMGWMMFDRIANIDSARYYYTKALYNGLPDSLKPQALYTMAVIERRAGLEDEARGYEDRLINAYPRNKYALGIMRARGLDPPKDSTQIYRDAYAEAAQALERGEIERGIALMKKLIEQYPHAEEALRAKLAIAMVYEDKRGSEALAMYREMVEKHPNSPYSKRGKEILAAIDMAEKNIEVEKARKAEEESRRAAEEEERKRKEERLRNPLLDEELKVLRDSVRVSTEPQKDPPRDDDFPLRPGGDKKKPQQPEKNLPFRNDPGSGPVRDLPVPGDTVRKLSPEFIEPE